MAPPSQLSIATSSINRLLKEESSYRTELAGQRKRLEKLEADVDGGAEEEEVGNREFELKQEVCFSFIYLMT
jgi:tubulin-specific chaperone A